MPCQCRFASSAVLAVGNKWFQSAIKFPDGARRESEAAGGTLNTCSQTQIQPQLNKSMWGDQRPLEGRPLFPHNHLLLLGKGILRIRANTFYEQTKGSQNSMVWQWPGRNLEEIQNPEGAKDRKNSERDKQAKMRCRVNSESVTVVKVKALELGSWVTGWSIMWRFVGGVNDIWLPSAVPLHIWG